VTSELTTQEEY